ncbi:MAG: pyruvate:ferredoxin (flavodoxin) oxidoreductase, partial [candidate division Zixibacteria bacterium]|nr:pyruvate:ferredoxin (flavodoxin) oxidoreductase [candidate division Zixibacteria bacterium]
GKPMPKKDLGLMMMCYNNIYVAQVSLGASHNQTVKAMAEAEAYNGPSIIIAYSHCIAHGIDMSHGLDNGANAVKSGHWPLYRYNPELLEKGENPLKLDCKAPSITFKDFAYAENRFRTLLSRDKDRADKLIKLGQQDCDRRWNFYSQMAAMTYGKSEK